MAKKKKSEDGFITDTMSDASLPPSAIMSDVPPLKTDVMDEIEDDPDALLKRANKELKLMQQKRDRIKKNKKLLKKKLKRQPTGKFSGAGASGDFSGDPEPMLNLDDFKSEDTPVVAEVAETKNKIEQLKDIKKRKDLSLDQKMALAKGVVSGRTPAAAPNTFRLDLTPEARFADLLRARTGDGPLTQAAQSRPFIDGEKRSPFDLARLEAADKREDKKLKLSKDRVKQVNDQLEIARMRIDEGAIDRGIEVRRLKLKMREFDRQEKMALLKEIGANARDVMADQSFTPEEKEAARRKILLLQDALQGSLGELDGR
jgi:hypothetical protein